MRNSKIVALVATAALLVLGAAFTSMAATYNWYQVDGIWHCKDKNGDDITQDWAKSGSDMYYLDENGEMVTETFIDVDDDYYYVDADGKMVKNDWVKVENDQDDDGDDYYWYYFQSSGKAKKGKGDATNKPISIGGKKYMFGADARMLYGWIADGVAVSGDYDWEDALYYAGGEDDGAIVTGWQKIDVLDQKEDIEDASYWFYFGTTGKKTFAKTEEKFLEKSINGKKYAFDTRGVMKAEWVQSVATATDASDSIGSYAWFRSAEEGAKLKKAWFRVVPTAPVNATDNEEETAHWYYAKGDGTFYHDCVKTIGGKKYAFNHEGEMMSGLFVMEIGTDGAINMANVEAIDTEGAVSTLTTPTTTAGTDAKEVYFFGDEETDGAMKYGTVKTEIDGDEYTFVFDSTGSKKGQAHNGLKGNYYYVNGAKVTADADMKYQIFNAVFDYDTTGKIKKVNKVGKQAAYGDTANQVLISSSGAIVKNGTKKDADDIKIKVENYKVTDYNFE